MAKTKKEYINIIQEVNKLIQEKRKDKGRFWNCYHDQGDDDLYGVDLSYIWDVEIDLTQTSYNLDFKVSTYQSRSENIYFYISLYDYETKKEFAAGYYYIKNHTGLIGELETTALLDIIEAGNKLTHNIYWNH